MNHRYVTGLTATAIAFAALSFVSVHAQTPADAKKADPRKPTPQTADGHPDLNGVWVGSIDFKPADPGKSVQILFPVRTDPESKKVFDEMDRAAQERQAAEPNKPPYKAELLAKVADLSQRRQFFDGAFYCKPTGIPRIGLPSQIVQTRDQIVFLYQGRNTFRVIPTDGRPHRTNQDPSYMGDAVGHWEGDTLVVDVNNLTDDSWLGADGWMHSDVTHIVERYRRDGDALSWSATVDDPKVFTKPWVMTPRTAKLNPNPKAMLEEDPPCLEQDGPHIVTNDHH